MLAPETIESLKGFGFQMSESFGQIEINLFSTQNPLDEERISTQTRAIKDLIDQFLLTIDYMENLPGPTPAESEETEEPDVHSAISDTD